MRYTVSNIPVELDEAEQPERQSAVLARISDNLGIDVDAITDCISVRRALDARKKAHIHFVCSFEVEVQHPLAEPLLQGVRPCPVPALQAPEVQTLPPRHHHVIVVGAGPAGLFAALALAEGGFRVSLLERGQPVEARMRDIGRLRSRGELSPESNICFGEGGAGTYTDGKLYTRIKNPLVRNVLHTFVRFGANRDILLDAHPHLGTDRLVRIVRNMRSTLLELGVDYRFGAKVEALLSDQDRVHGVRLADGEEIAVTHVVLAIGHSARDTYEHLHASGIRLEAKDFAVGLRAEHPQELINRIQFGNQHRHPVLAAAEYSLTHQANDTYLGKRGVYSFCMCPGGLIVPSPTEPGAMAVNGMSNAKRSGAFANAGIVVQLTPADIARHGIDMHPLMGVAFQRELEQATFRAAGNPYKAPAMRITDFVAGKPGGTLAPCRFKPGVVAADLHELLPGWITSPLADGIRAFDRRMRGYITNEANLLACETRTSSPLRITRNADMQSVSLTGLYPVGEGAGYAGGIVSAAVDGLKAAEKIISAD